MTASEWRTSDDAAAMLEAVRGRISDRKLRLIAVACCRHAFNLFVDPVTVRVVMAAEAFADGELTAEALTRAYQVAVAASHAATGSNYGDHIRRAAVHAADPGLRAPIAPLYAAMAAADLPAGVRRLPPGPRDEGYAEYRAEMSVLADLVRDVAGDRFRPVAVDPAWRTATVAGLAAAIYRDRAYDRLPILADALEEAGAGNVDLLTHLRGDGPHVRGCWALDAVVGRS